MLGPSRNFFRCQCPVVFSLAKFSACYGAARPQRARVLTAVGASTLNRRPCRGANSGRRSTAPRGRACPMGGLLAERLDSCLLTDEQGNALRQPGSWRAAAAAESRAARKPHGAARVGLPSRGSAGRQPQQHVDRRRDPLAPDRRGHSEGQQGAPQRDRVRISAAAEVRGCAQ